MFKHPSMGAHLIILDASLSITTPRETWQASGVRAIDHCIEGLSSPQHTSSSDEHFSQGLRLLIPNLLITNKEWENEEARLQSMMQMGASHGIGHQLGPLGVGHGQTSCVLLPAVLTFNLKYGGENVGKRQKMILDVLWGKDVIATFLKRKGFGEESELGDVVGAVVGELSLPRTLKDVGIAKEKFDELARNSLKDPWLKTNVVPVNKIEQVLEILDLAQ
jgi:alcohol dehydrogenase class IV